MDRIDLQTVKKIKNNVKELQGFADEHIYNELKETLYFASAKLVLAFENMAKEGKKAFIVDVEKFKKLLQTTKKII